jgi:dihydrofolate reductase
MAQPLGMIVAMTRDRVIGLDNRLPWRYPADLARFKRLTIGSTVIMGRKTWESLPKRPLVDRRNVVITRSTGLEVEHFPSLELALGQTSGPAWIIGGAELYRAALPLVDFIDVTWVPDVVDAPAAVQFPPFPPDLDPEPEAPHPDDPRLVLQRYTRRR